MMSAPDNVLQLLYIRLRLTEDALKDAVAGLKYIRQQHGELYGVGFDRVFKKAEELREADNHDYYGEAG